MISFDLKTHKFVSYGFEGHKFDEFFWFLD